ncbi:MAG: hypothetical protein EHM77_04005, partial [Planctomycetaceae bacterium]
MLTSPKKLAPKIHSETAPKALSDRFCLITLEGTRMKNLIIATVLVLSQVFFSANQGLGRETDEDELTLIQKTVVPESIRGLSWGATIDLGTLVSGKKYRIHLDVTNPSGSVMSFS